MCTTQVVKVWTMMEQQAPMTWQCRDRRLEIDERPLLMAILNVTPDSFSDGGRYDQTERAVARGGELAAAGADIVDIGGESTRPGADAVSIGQELERVIPVIEAVHKASEVAISVDTTKAEVARQALAAGAIIINDVSALTHDAGMPPLARETGAGLVLMHRQGTPRTMQAAPRYDDVVSEVANYLSSRLAALTAEGIGLEHMVVDPGIGFGKTLEHNLALLTHLPVMGNGRPILVGLSRKSLLGALTGREVRDRTAAGVAAMTYCMLRGAHIMRVHDLPESLDAVQVVTALRRAEGGNAP